MKHFRHIDEIEVLFRDTRVGRLTASADGRTVTFEYDPNWIVTGFSVSPLELPLRSGVFRSTPGPFSGNFGVFEDSLPDGYGRYLLYKMLQREGLDYSQLSVAARLALVGESGMGALTYRPAVALPSGDRIKDMELLQRKAFEVLREKQDDDASLLLFNSGNSGGARPKAVYADSDGHWLVKLRHTYDPEDMGLKEYATNQLARDAGIDLPDFRLINNRFFASRRFDIGEEGERYHVVTAGGLLGLSLNSGVIDYSSLLQLTGYLTQDAAQVEEMYRRMVFNYLIDNRDDHCKNFSFMVVKTAAGSTWRLTPAYDLVPTEPGYNGEHATTVNWKARPVLSDFIEVGTKIRMDAARCLEIISQMQHRIGKSVRYRIDI